MAKIQRNSNKARARRNSLRAAQIKFRNKNPSFHVPKVRETFKLNPLNGRYECPDCGKTREEIFAGVMSEADLQEMLANMY